MQDTKKIPERIWLKILRIKKGYSQLELGKAVGLSGPTISNYESGELTPKPPAAMRLAKELGFDWKRFYEETETSENEAEGA